LGRFPEHFAFASLTIPSSSSIEKSSLSPNWVQKGREFTQKGRNLASTTTTPSKANKNN